MYWKLNAYNSELDTEGEYKEYYVEQVKILDSRIPVYSIQSDKSLHITGIMPGRASIRHTVQSLSFEKVFAYPKPSKIYDLKTVDNNNNKN